ncbi:S1 family peptidase [Arsukibacterium indicum]|uniref:Serine protease n=1 Tax=Arsukibacterium indicum TaxID=2848612 RepID=A0ABS6MFY1_9GAMM|nr:serine protease [Arsukibacterium indicum]MBV2127726.1 serine protease [Arsukibacterium indicum]
MVKHIYLLSIFLLFSFPTQSTELIETLKKIKPSVVAIGISNPTASPRIRLIGSGFVVSPGNRVVTNYHVVAAPLDESLLEQYVVLSGQGTVFKVHPVQKQRNKPAFDLALLTIAERLPALSVSSEPMLAEGSSIAFTGFPITQVLGLYPATHSGIIAAQTPIAIPAVNARELQAAMLRQLDKPYLVYQLDAVAYPGNSGSPLYRPDNGEVIGIINQVYIKSSREAVLSDPSGISYAIPSRHLLDLMQQPD